MATFKAADPGYKHRSEYFANKMKRFFPTKAFADLLYSPNTEADYFTKLNLGTIKEPTFYSGSGVPALATVPNGGELGSYYFRTDTPATANQRIYVCTVAGTASVIGTFVAIL